MKQIETGALVCALLFAAAAPRPMAQDEPAELSKEETAALMQQGAP